MGRWLIPVIMIICFTIGIAEAQEKTFESKRYFIETSGCVVYKTDEEIAWDIVIYAIKNIPSMTFRIKHYEDLLEAYRKALNVIKEPKAPIPPAPEKRG
ncbi:MAG: hypothetical protein ACPL1G_00205 [Thermodesulfovibrionales bacterium]